MPVADLYRVTEGEEQLRLYTSVALFHDVSLVMIFSLYIMKQAFETFDTSHLSAFTYIASRDVYDCHVQK